MHIRWMIRRDMAEVLDIDRRSFRSSAWSEKDFLTQLKQSSVIGMVAEVGEGEAARVVGYMIYELAKRKFTLLRLAVHPEERRNGVGRAMVKKLLDKLAPNGRRQLVATIPDDDIDACAFLHRAGLHFLGTISESGLFVWTYNVLGVADNADELERIRRAT